MDNNKTIVMSDELQVSQPSREGKINLSSLSSNKTIILADDVVSNENVSYQQQTDGIKPPLKTNKEKSFDDFFAFNHSNKLLGYATPILSFVNRIRTLKEYDASIFQTAVNLVHAYIKKLKEAQIKTEILQSASFIVCMSIDEVALKCSWCYSSPWITKGVLDTFFQQSQDDGYFLNLIEYYLANQNKNQDILEVFGVCLSICTRGNNSNQGAIKSENLRHKILNALSNFYPTLNEGNFSPHAVPSDQIKSSLSSSVPLWIIAVVFLFILASIYIGFRVALSLTSEPVYNSIIQLYQPGQNK